MGEKCQWELLQGSSPDSVYIRKGNLYLKGGNKLKLKENKPYDWKFKYAGSGRTEVFIENAAGDKKLKKGKGKNGEEPAKISGKGIADVKKFNITLKNWMSSAAPTVSGFIVGLDGKKLDVKLETKTSTDFDSTTTWQISDAGDGAKVSVIGEGQQYLQAHGRVLDTTSGGGSDPQRCHWKLAPASSNSNDILFQSYEERFLEVEGDKADLVQIPIAEDGTIIPKDKQKWTVYITSIR